MEIIFHAFFCDTFKLNLRIYSFETAKSGLHQAHGNTAGTRVDGHH
jgi:hypothetical protein